MRAVVLFLTVAFVAACADEPQRPTLDVRARYVGPAYGGEAITVEHEAIPGRMPAMQMALALSDPALVEGVRPGDPLRLRLDSASLRVVGVEPLPAGSVLDLEPDEAPSAIPLPTDSL